LPNHAVVSTLRYLDPDCTVRAGFTSDVCVQDPYLTKASTDRCPTTYQVYRAGKKITGGYGGSVTGCKALPPSTNTNHYEIGSEVPLTEFAPVLTSLHGTDRIRWRTYDTGLSTLGPIYTDSKLGIDCRTLVAADKVRRCLPSGIAENLLSSMFSDAGCKSLLGRFPACAYYALYGNETKTYRVYGRGAKFSGQVYTKSKGICSAVNTAGDLTAVFHELGADIDPTEFAEMP
jgi:hypothetical protein